MAEDSKKDLEINSLRDKARAYKEQRMRQKPDSGKDTECSWRAVSKVDEAAQRVDGLDNFLSFKIDFVGKNLEGGRFANENLENANFSVANLKGVDFSGANLRGVDLSGADLTGANLRGADLTGAILSGAQLSGADLTGAKLNNVKLTDVDIENAILLDIEMDDITREDLQELVEYLAKYYPHKLQLSKINLMLLDLTKIDLKNLDLRGVDFTGVDFTGVNIMELDLSECIITPQQIAQALGRVPTPEEMKMLLAPKKKKDGKGSVGIDMTSLLLGDGKEFGVWDTIHQEGISIEQILEVGKKVFRRNAKRPPVKDGKVLEEVKSAQQKAADENKAALRRQIEEHKRQELENRRSKKQELEQEVRREEAVKEERREEKTAERPIDVRILSRGGNER